jgi:hypothetical protein
MPVTVRIVAFSERRPILLRRKVISMQPVGGAKSIAPRHVYRWHSIGCLWWMDKQQGPLALRSIPAEKLIDGVPTEPATALMR